MKKEIKLSALALLAAVAASTTTAQTNLLQAVSVGFATYQQGPTNITTVTNYLVDKGSFGSKDLVNILSSNGFQNGDILVRATPVIITGVTVTNLEPGGTNILVITNESTSEEIVSNYLILNTNAPVFIGDTNVTYSSDTEVIDGLTVTLGTNIATVGTDTNALTLVVGTNTTVTVIPLTNGVGNPVGTSNIFVSNTLTNSVTPTNKLGTASWQIYNKHTKPQLTPISTNVYFNIYTDHVHADGTNAALVHGQTVAKNGVIKFGTTDEIRILVLSNSAWNIKLQGYANGHYVPVSLGGSDVVYSQTYNWTGSGSGTSNSVPVILDGFIDEDYLTELK
ncbi:MAG: hypothetical protein ABSA83_04685 [Verrucomicrobiota bacterium]